PSKMRTFRNATALDIACEAPAAGRDMETATATRPVTRQNTTAACQCFLVSGIPISITLLPAPEEPARVWTFLAALPSPSSAESLTQRGRSTHSFSRGSAAPSSGGSPTHRSDFRGAEYM